MKESFLLRSALAETLFSEVSRLPIVDYHNHLSMACLKKDERFENVTQLWIRPDPYKHRAMRILGVSEEIITGDGDDFVCFSHFMKILPRLMGTPLYDWSVLEFSRVFGIDLDPCLADVEALWQETKEKLKTLSARRILALFPVSYAAPCTALCDDLSVFEGETVLAPSLRGDDLIVPTRESLLLLSRLTGQRISTLAHWKKAVQLRLDAFRRLRCRFADHALDDGFVYVLDDGKNEERFARLCAGETLTAQETEHLSSHLLKTLAVLYEKNGLTLQLHVGAARFTSSRLRRIAGAQGGFAAIGNRVAISSVTSFLDEVEKETGLLPKTLLFNLNPADNAAFAVLSGSYSREGQEAIVSQGPAWWWCDHHSGMKKMLEDYAAFGVLSTFVGMTTDSRSLLSLVRHEYFRRVLCNFVAEKVEEGILPDHLDHLKDLVRRMSYENAAALIVEKGE